jgi:hypothetical protein
MEASDRLVEFRRTGGRAANDDHLIVDHAGQAVLRTPKGIRHFELGPGTVGAAPARAGDGWSPRAC